MSSHYDPTCKPSIAHAWAVRTNALGTFCFLVIAAAMIWWCYATRMADPWKSMPIMAGFPFFFWLARPWRFRKSVSDVSIFPILIACFLFLLGLASGLIVLSVVAWTAMVWCWINAFFETSSRQRKRLFPILILSFPWIANDLLFVSDGFRWTGAVFAEKLAGLVGIDVCRSGFNLMTGEMNISVGEGCAGTETLQTLLVFGCILLGSCRIQSSRYWLYPPFLFLIAWCVNSLRIVVLVFMAAYSRSYELTANLHDATGYISLLVAVPLMYLGLRAITVFGDNTSLSSPECRLSKSLPVGAAQHAGCRQK